MECLPVDEYWDDSRREHPRFTLESRNTFAIVAERFGKPARSKMCCDFVMCEFGADHGVNKICGRILSKNLHVPHSFNTYDNEEMKMIRQETVGKKVAMGNNEFPDFLQEERIIVPPVKKFFSVVTTIVDVVQLVRL